MNTRRAAAALALAALALAGCADAPADRPAPAAQAGMLDDLGAIVDRVLGTPAPPPAPDGQAQAAVLGTQATGTGYTNWPARANYAAARATLSKLVVKGRGPKTGYDRTGKFGTAWSDADGNRNGCDERNDMLARDMVNETFKAGTRNCLVLTGTLKDAYSGKTIQFRRGTTTSSAVQIEHRVPLLWAWQHGAQQWTQQKRENFANDAINLIAVDGPTNSSKGASGPAAWMPPNRGYWCEYLARQVVVLAKYGLSINPADKTATERYLKAC